MSIEAVEYLGAGLKLIPIPRGKKGPIIKCWNIENNCITSPADAGVLSDCNIGLAHLFSRTCTVDIDDYKSTKGWMQKRSIDIDKYLNADNAVKIISGVENRAKLLYQLPEGVEFLTTYKINEAGLELRCATADGKKTMQDVLPPSIHPGTNKPYSWGGKGNWKNLPVLPDELLNLWREHDKTQHHNKHSVSEIVIREGSRNDTLFRLGCSLRNNGLDKNAIEVTLLEYNIAKCNPPLPDNEVSTIARSAAKYNPRSMPLPLNDAGNAERFIRDHGDNIRYNPESKKWLYYESDSGRWNWDDAKCEVMRCAKQTVSNIHHEAAYATSNAEEKRLSKWAISSGNAAKLNSMLEIVSKDIRSVVWANDLDSDKYLMGVTNGVVDLRTGQLLAPRREMYITKCSGTYYDPEAKAPEWHKFMDSIFNGSQEMINFIQRMAGYILTGDTSEQVVLIFHGNGRNGKTTLVETMLAVNGDYGAKAEMSTFLHMKRDGPRNDLAALRGSRFVTAAEIGAGSRLNEPLIKEVSGCDTITARFLYGEHFAYKPQFKVALITNVRPEVHGTDEGVWRRIRLVPFDVTIALEAVNKHLPQILLTELHGILAWMVRGCLAWQRDGLQQPEAVLLATKQYREESDWLSAFLAAACLTGEAAEHASASAGALYRAYCDWCDEQGEQAVKQRTFGTFMGNHGYRAKVCTLNGRSQRVYKGIGLIDYHRGANDEELF